MQQFLGFSVNTLGGGFRGFRAEGKEGFGVSPPVIFSGGKHRRRAPGAPPVLGGKHKKCNVEPKE